MNEARANAQAYDATARAQLRKLSLELTFVDPDKIEGQSVQLNTYFHSVNKNRFSEE